MSLWSTTTMDYIRALIKPSPDRSIEDNLLIFKFLRSLEPLGSLKEEPLRALSKTVRYERHLANETLYRKGQPSSSWFILLSGSVFIDGTMYLPHSGFGKRTACGNGQLHLRVTDCYVLEHSEMIVIDYPDILQAKMRPAGYANSMPPPFSSGLQPSTSLLSSQSRQTSAGGGQLAVGPNGTFTRGGKLPRRPSELSQSSSTSSCGHSARGKNSNSAESLVVIAAPPRSHLYSHLPRRPNNDQSALGRLDTQPPPLRCQSWRSDTTGGDDQPDLNGLPENPVDSSDLSDLGTTSDCEDVDLIDDDDVDDDESCPSGGGDSLMDLRDTVRECLEKEPIRRGADEIAILLEFLQLMPSFAQLPHSLKRDLCAKMVFAVVDQRGTVVMSDGEPMDSWCVIVNGEVEVLLPDGSRREFRLGESFGIEPRLEPQLHRGVMRTLVDDCQFVLVAQADYCEILGRMRENVRKQIDTQSGQVVSETEKRTFANGATEGYIMIKARPDRLIQALVEERDTSVDPNFVEDFLLTYRTFIPTAEEIFDKLLSWFDDVALRDKVARLVLLWVNNHFNDFETNSAMIARLERFESLLDQMDMPNHQQLLNIACSVKSRQRLCVYTRSNRDEILHFSILGGFDRGGQGVFISKVESDSLAERVGLKRGDQILEVNGQNFRQMSHTKALEILRGSTHLSITVKSNLLGFKEMLTQPDGVDFPDSIRAAPGGHLPPHMQICRGSLPGSPQSRHQMSHSQMVDTTSTAHTGRVGKIEKLLMRIKRGGNSSSTLNGGVNLTSVDLDCTDGRQHVRLRPSRSNPDISGFNGGDSVGSSSSTGLNVIQGGLAQYYQPISSQFSPEHVLKVYRSDQSYKYLTVYRETPALNVVQLGLQEFGMTGESSSDYSLAEVTVAPGNLIKQRRLPDQMQNLAERIALNSRYYLKSLKSSEPLVPDELGAELLKDSVTNLLQLSPAILAAQLTLQDFSVFAAIEQTEYVDNLFRLQSAYKWPKLDEFEGLVNRETFWVATEVVQESKSVQKRAKIVKKFIQLAKHCKDFKNFNSMFAILSGLEKPSVQRLHSTWDKVPNKYRKIHDDLRLIIDPSRNMSKYRQLLMSVSGDPPAVPLFPILKKDLTFIHEGNKTWIDGMVNFEKLRMLAKEVRNASRLASAPYELHSMFESARAGRLNDALLHLNSFDGGTNVATMRKKHQTATSHISRRKLYEQALMVRRVKSYLTELEVISDETQLDRLSIECEPLSQSALNSAISVSNWSNRLKSGPSPSPSNGSGQSAEGRRFFNGPKFGAESPQAVQKLMSLVETSRIRPAKTAIHTGNVSPNQSPVANRRNTTVGHHNHHTSNSRGVMASLTHSHVTGGSSNSAHSQPAPVDLTAESSSVTTLLNPRLPGSGSITSAPSCDSTDSGHVSLDAISTQSGQNSPPSQRRSYPPPKSNSGSQVAPVRPVLPPAYGDCRTVGKTASLAPKPSRSGSVPTGADRLDEDEQQISRV